MLTDEERNTIISALREWEQHWLRSTDEGTRVLLRTARVIASAREIDELCRRISERECTAITRRDN
jgi:hypothetical protein